MKIIKLSNFVREKLDEEIKHRKLKDLNNMEGYQKETQRHEAQIKSAKKEYDDAKGFFDSIAKGFKYVDQKYLKSSPSKPDKTCVSASEHKLKEGLSGEESVLDFLEKKLGNDWTAITGYTNMQGEIDLLLVGGGGLWAFELKNYNGDISCKGDRYSRDKYDNYGNMVEQNLPIVDRRGRSPSEQLNQPLWSLEKYLYQNKIERQFVRVVLFVNAKSTIASVEKPTVEHIWIFQDLSEHLKKIVKPKDKVWNDDNCKYTVDLICKDHEYFSKKLSQKE